VECPAYLKSGHSADPVLAGQRLSGFDGVERAREHDLCLGVVVGEPQVRTDRVHECERLLQVGSEQGDHGTRRLLRCLSHSVAALLHEEQSRLERDASSSYEGCVLTERVASDQLRGNSQPLDGLQGDHAHEQGCHLGVASDL
jgi:hypothetical protein